MKLALILALALATAAAPQSSQAPAPKDPPPKVSLPPVTIKSPVNDGLDQCRSACGKARYVCLQQNDSETCDPIWQTCRSDCARVYGG